MDQIIGNFGLLLDFPIVNIKILIDGLMIGALFALAAYGPWVWFTRITGCTSRVHRSLGYWLDCLQAGNFTRY